MSANILDVLMLNFAIRDFKLLTTHRICVTGWFLYNFRRDKKREGEAELLSFPRLSYLCHQR